MIEISFELNGSPERVAVAVDETLLSVLRERLGYTGTKDGMRHRRVRGVYRARRRPHGLEPPPAGGLERWRAGDDD